VTPVTARFEVRPRRQRPRFPPTAGRCRGHRQCPERHACARPKPGRAVNRIARQFGGPSGPIGHLAARPGQRRLQPLAGPRARQGDAPSRGRHRSRLWAGIALRELPGAYPAACVVGVDPSPVALKSARRRNAPAIADGRLTLVTGDIEQVPAQPPAGLVLACHVLYFWADPVRGLRRVRENLAPHGRIALGYQLRQHMPPITQRTFPREGFTLHDCDDQVGAVLRQAGFTPPEIRVFGDPSHPGGRHALATAAPGPPGQPARPASCCRQNSHSPMRPAQSPAGLS
jgi:SAM-dependent methyltransferase